MEWRKRPGSWWLVGRLRLGLATLGRWPKLGWNLARGYFNRLRERAWWQFFSTFVLVAIPLLYFAIEGHTDWITPLNVALVFFAAVLVRWLLQARGRVIVESFVDFTKEDAKAVSGLSTLLVTELGRLRELYQQIDDLSIPTALGVESHGGFGRGKEAGVFLTVSADDATSVLEDAVPADAGIGVGPAKVSLKPVLTFINRVTRGPRVVGSVHLTEAGGGPTLTAQLLGKGQCMTWRIDQPREPESPEQRKAFLDTMVRELACRMFAQQTLHGSVRPKAVEAFNEYMQFYDEARRTPRDRAYLLKKARGRLLKAVSEDEQFDLAYYNLGVIYMQIAHTERVVEQQTDDATSRANFDRSELDAARGEAARVAFERAAAKNPNRWEAYYALGVTVFSEIHPEVKIEEPLDRVEDEPRRDKLREVISFCDQALAVAPNRSANLAAIYDLRGMAQTRLGNRFGKALSDHRKAVYHSWVEYCRARRRGAERADGLPDLVAHSRANGAAALHNLALAHERRALIGRTRKKSPLRDRLMPSRLEFLVVHMDFRRARWMGKAGSEVTPAIRFERGGAYERVTQRGWPTLAAANYRRAVKQFRMAARIHTRSSEYHARLAQALAGRWRREADRGRADGDKAVALKNEVEIFAGLALDLLAQPFSLAVLPFGTEAINLRCKATLAALEETWERVDEGEEVARIREIEALRETLKETLSVKGPKTGRRSKPEDPSPRADALEAQRSELEGIAGDDAADDASTDPRTWQLDQIELAMGRLYADGRDWERARGIFDQMVSRLKREKRTKRIVEFGVFAHQARALRECEEKSFVTALKVAAEGVRRAPLDIEARREAGRAHFALGQYSDALDAWRHALWISPTDPYLHYEVGLCHRALAADQTDEEKRQQEMLCARTHFDKARELFDGEDLNGEAWARLWQGKIALEADNPMEALEFLKGAEHATARAAAALLLGEAHLQLDQRPAADHAFKRCEEALEGKIGGKATTAETISTIGRRPTIDALWGDELPFDAVRARVARGKAEAQHLAPGDWQTPREVSRAKEHLAVAWGRVRKLERKHPSETAARDEVRTRILETESRLHQANGEIEKALERIRDRLRYKKTEGAQRLEAELLELRAANGPTLDDSTRWRLAAKHVKKSLSQNGRRPAGSSSRIS